ncbi:MAG: multicopper oxidase domain-containing protein, partial [Gemmatimonadaceae bacterium]|nr:multicopper oxidase domain-containing protein [Gemmatimonadaceae bacterium]
WRAWPFSERLTYAQGDSVHWRFINASADVHPLHLHGFYFRVNARGDMQRDTLYAASQQRMGVTELFDEQNTADISWKADRPGGWVFHCHLNYHVLPNPALGDGMLSADSMNKLLMSAPVMDGVHGAHMMANHAETGMGGLLLAIKVTPAGVDAMPKRANACTLHQTDCNRPTPRVDSATRWRTAMRSHRRTPFNGRARPSSCTREGPPASWW